MSLSVRALSFSYGKQAPVLRDVRIEPITPGRLTALIGPNAAGKSTLFRCIAGILPCPQATVYLDDDDLALSSRREWSKQVCFVPQGFMTSAALTVFDLVLLARKHLSGWRVTSQDIDASETVLLKLGIGHLAETYVGDLSGGQQQMVSLSQALVREPALFLLDEPTSALDLRHQLEIMTVIRDVTSERGITTIVALHDLNLAARFADEMILMREGEIAATGPPKDILCSQELEDTYGVNLDVHTTSDDVLMVSARL
ncbi:MAG: ABC transporter ATP-binding protein [Pseudomonadota bacterium]